MTAGVSAFFAARRAKAQEVRLESVHELAAVVLPSSLGKEHTDKIADDFVRWFRDYKSGAQIASGYGHPRTQVTGPNPAANYPAQMQALGSPITREAVEGALQAANIARIPSRPGGKHIAADLLAYFYGSSTGEDFLYNAAIKRDDCRGLSSSAQRPARLS
jgi:hypothetical protein